MYGIRTTARTLAENPQALEAWLVYVTATLYEVRRRLGLTEEDEGIREDIPLFLRRDSRDPQE